MKQISITISLALSCTIVNAQNIIGSHQVRVNDEVKKQQVEYVAVDSYGLDGAALGRHAAPCVPCTQHQADVSPFLSRDKTEVYTMTYDHAGRLSSAVYLEEGVANQHYDEAFTYDKMGNVQGIVHYGLRDNSQYGLIDNVSLYYNGNLTRDRNKGILQIQYNLLNLPSKTTFSDGYINYQYSASGMKQMVSGYAPGQGYKSQFYLGNYVYSSGTVKQLLVDGGYVTFSGTTPQYHFYVKDHLGNNRMVVNASGMVEQVSHYYAFGGLMGESRVSERKVETKTPISSGLPSLATSVRLTFSRFETLFSYRRTVVS